MKRKIKTIEKYGRQFIERFLKQDIYKKGRFYRNWYEALKFLLARSFYRGRRDELSTRFLEATLKTLDEFKLNKNYNQKLLNLKLKSNGVNNERDRKMTLEIINLVFNLPSFYKNNIVRYTIDQIKSGNTKGIFNTLDNIFAIGDKLASIYLRDIVMVYRLEKYLKSEDLKYCQPIDTWVQQVVLKVGIIKSEKEKIEDIKSAIIKRCLDAKVNPLLFNAGAWLVGARSFELLLEKL